MRKRLRSWVFAAAVAAVAATPIALSSGAATQATASTSRPSASGAGQLARYHGKHAAIDCARSSGMCVEVANSDKVFGHYVGHDEPSVLFQSHVPGSGNHMRYNLVLPKDPSASNPNAVNKGYAFELSGSEWLGMAMCDTQSFPEQVKTCPPDTDKNILDPRVSARHVGEAYMELQFYPPGWIPWPTWQVAVGASSCNPTMWCAALNIDSLSVNPVTGQQLNAACQRRIGSVEYVNFAIITKNGKSTGPANPVDATTKGTYTPSPADLFMHSGDHLSVSLTDTPNGLKTTINDLTTGQSGFMTASKANGFGQVKFAPTGTSCTDIPYNFHPMYSTASPQTRVTWAVGSYNIAFDTEIGHFQFCTGKVAIPDTPFGLTKNGTPTVCPKGDSEGRGASKGKPDGDDTYCFPAKEPPVYKVAGCTFNNDPGFDGASYQKLWPDGNTKDNPTPFQFTSPLTGPRYHKQYARAGFESDLPANESYCNVSTGAGCNIIPTTDKGKPAAFYPFYSTTKLGKAGCYWQFGNVIPGAISNFGKDVQYGSLLKQDFTTGHKVTEFIYDFRKIITNPCK
jgi:hypothetical protein